MTDLITASADELHRQATLTATDYLVGAAGAIDDHFGPGYAADNPALLATFMTIAAADFRTAIVLKALAPALERLAEGELS